MHVTRCGRPKQRQPQRASACEIASYLPDSDGKALPAGHAVLHLVILGPLPGQRLGLLDLQAARAGLRIALSFIRDKRFLKQAVDAVTDRFLPGVFFCAFSSNSSSAS